MRVAVELNQDAEEIQVIGNHEKVRNRDFQAIEPIPYGLSAEVHVSGRLQQSNRIAVQPQLGDCPVPFG